MASYPIRPVAEDELADFLAVDQHASHDSPMPERARANLLARLESDRTLAAFDGDTIADIHVIDAEKTNGDSVRTKVIAFFTVRNGKIARVDELTHLLLGADQDRDIGSRTSDASPNVDATR